MAVRTASQMKTKTRQTRLWRACCTQFAFFRINICRNNFVIHILWQCVTLGVLFGSDWNVEIHDFAFFTINLHATFVYVSFVIFMLHFEIANHELFFCQPMQKTCKNISFWIFAVVFSPLILQIFYKKKRSHNLVLFLQCSRCPKVLPEASREGTSEAALGVISI